MEKLEVIQIRKRKQTKEPVRQPDTYDKVVESFRPLTGISLFLFVQIAENIRLET